MAKFVMDYNKARAHYSRTRWDAVDEYSPAYIISTENLLESIGLFRGAMDDVLTVAGSGDQALLYAARGAKHVDTFDLSFCAKAIQDIKTAAVQKMSRYQYVQLLDDLHWDQRHSHNILGVHGMNDVMKLMPSDTSAFVSNLADCRILSRGECPPSKWPQHLPTEDEYMKMYKKVTRPFNFIWTDIADVHMYLTQSYDVINTSNVFDWVYNQDSVAPMLVRLFEYLKVGGYIQAVSFNAGVEPKASFMRAADALGGRAVMDFSDKMRLEEVMILRKVR